MVQGIPAPSGDPDQRERAGWPAVGRWPPDDLSKDPPRPREPLLDAQERKNFLMGEIFVVVAGSPRQIA